MQIQVFQFLDGCHQTATKVIVSQTASQSQDSSNPSCSYGPMRTLSQAEQKWQQTQRIRESFQCSRHRITIITVGFSVPGILWWLWSLPLSRIQCSGMDLRGAQGSFLMKALQEDGVHIMGIEDILHELPHRRLGHRWWQHHNRGKSHILIRWTTKPIYAFQIRTS